MNSNIADRKHGSGIVSVTWLVVRPLVRAVDKHHPDQKVNTAIRTTQTASSNIGIRFE